MITARDLATRDGCASVAQWMQKMAERSIQRGRFSLNWDGVHVSGMPISAFIDFSRWLVKCECNQFNYVDPDEPVLFCACCGNGNSGMARPVLFPSPSERLKIEAILMERPVTQNPLAKNAIEAARLEKPVFEFLLRSWYPSQRIDDLLAMNSMLKES